MKKALVTGGTKNDIDAMAVLAINAKEKCPDLFDELVIFHDGVDSDIQKLVNTVVPTKFIRYKCPVSKIKLMLNGNIRYFSPMVFCKIECFRLLKEYDVVTWSDYDVVIKEDISDLLYCEGNSFVVNYDTTLEKMFLNSLDRSRVCEYNLHGESVCTPLFVLKRECISDVDVLCEWYYHTLNKLYKHLYLPEQCLFTMMGQRWNIVNNRLNPLEYSEHPSNDNDSVRIIHAYGQPKFWNGLFNENWNTYYQQWCDIKNGKNT